MEKLKHETKEIWICGLQYRCEKDGKYCPHAINHPIHDNCLNGKCQIFPDERRISCINKIVPKPKEVKE